MESNNDMLDRERIERQRAMIDGLKWDLLRNNHEDSKREEALARLERWVEELGK